MKKIDPDNSNRREIHFLKKFFLQEIRFKQNRWFKYHSMSNQIVGNISDKE